MADRLTPAQRRQNMRSVKQRNTKPELVVRRALHKLGYRFRLHRKDLPGTPDIILPKYKTCLFVHGCFWHQHSDCKRAAVPASNRTFWLAKLQGNKERDNITTGLLRKAGWNVVVIWECQTKKPNVLDDIIESFMRKTSKNVWS